jgi:hypothetical protein
MNFLNLWLGKLKPPGQEFSSAFTSGRRVFKSHKKSEYLTNLFSWTDQNHSLPTYRNGTDQSALKNAQSDQANEAAGPP